MTYDEAESNLRKAIEDHARAVGIANDDELLSTFAVIAHWQKVEADGHSRYTTTFDGGTVPTHVAVGLFATGQHLVQFCEEEDE